MSSKGVKVRGEGYAMEYRMDNAFPLFLRWMNHENPRKYNGKFIIDVYASDTIDEDVKEEYLKWFRGVAEFPAMFSGDRAMKEVKVGPKKIVFSYPTPESKDKITSVSVIGTFNNWKPQKMKMKDIIGGQLMLNEKKPVQGFEAVLKIPMGMHQYKFLVTKEGATKTKAINKGKGTKGRKKVAVEYILDPSNSVTLSTDDGHKNNMLQLY